MIIKLLNGVVRNGSFLAGGVLECNLAHRRSVAKLCMLFKIKSNLMHSLNGALPLAFVSELVTRGAYGCSYRRITRSRTILFTAGHLCLSQYLNGASLMTLCLMMWDWRVLREEPMPSCWPNLTSIFVSSYCLSFFLPRVGCAWLGSSD